MHGTEFNDFVVICYNIHSLMKFQERIDWLMEELGNQRWDLIVFSETWRAERVEVMRTEHGHTWLGSGGANHKRGVGFLLHRRWKHLRFKPLSDRVGVIDLRILRGVVLRLIAVYMPHSGQPDEVVEQVYGLLEEQCREAKAQGYMTALTGDFNAEVGTFRDFDDSTIIGSSSMPNRSDRGAWLLNWCTLMRYKIANTFGGNTASETYWTYRHCEVTKVLDHFLVDACLAALVEKCGVFSGMDTGSDHRPLYLSFSCKARRKNKKKRNKKRSAWTPDASYISKLSSLLSENPSPALFGTRKADFLHQSLLRAKEATAVVSSTDPSTQVFSLRDKQAQGLIEERRKLNSYGLSRTEMHTRRVALGKQIQKTIRLKRAQEKTDKINSILGEGRDLKRLSSLLAPPKSKGIVEMRDRHGSTKHDKSDIAEVFASFYEDLYRSRSNTRSADTYKLYADKAIFPFTRSELRSALKQMKAGKAKDAAGICAEMVTVDCHLVHEMIMESSMTY